MHEKAEVFTSRFASSSILPGYPRPSDSSLTVPLFLPRINASVICHTLRSLIVCKPPSPESIQSSVIKAGCPFMSPIFLSNYLLIVLETIWISVFLNAVIFLTIAVIVCFPSNLSLRKYLKLSFPTGGVQFSNARDC